MLRFDDHNYIQACFLQRLGLGKMMEKKVRCLFSANFLTAIDIMAAFGLMSIYSVTVSLDNTAEQNIVLERNYDQE